MSEPIRMLGIEDRLAADPEGKERDAIMARLHDAYRMFKQELDAGAESERYLQLTALVDALDAARKIVPILWGDLQQRPTTSR